MNDAPSFTTEEDINKFKQQATQYWVELTEDDEREAYTNQLKFLRKTIGQQIQLMAQICFFLDGLQAEHDARAATEQVRSNAQ
jgi:hypothetical protein